MSQPHEGMTSTTLAPSRLPSAQNDLIENPPPNNERKICQVIYFLSWSKTASLMEQEAKGFSQNWNKSDV